MTELERIQQAKSLGFSIDDIRAAYIAKNKPLPKELEIPETEMIGEGLPKSVRLGMTALQGPTFGFSDELFGIGTSLLGRRQDESLPEAYARGRDIYRAGVEKYQEEQPIGSIFAQTAASLPLSLTKLGAIAAPASVPMVARPVIQGIESGIIGGVGEAPSVEQIPEYATTGGTTGGVFAGGTQIVGNVARPVVQAVGRQVAAKVPKMIGELGGFSPTDMARRRIAQAMLRDGSDIPQIQARLSKLGDEAVLAEAAGINTKDLLDTMATLPGRTKNFTEELIRQRQATRGKRIIGAAQQQLSPTGARYADTVESLITKREIEAGPLYQQVKPMQVMLDADMIEMLEASRKLGAFKNAEKIATATQEEFNVLSRKLKVGDPLTVRELDLVKKGLDVVVNSGEAINPKTGKMNEFGSSVLGLKNKFVEKIDEATKDKSGQSLYKQARDAYAGPSALIDAAELGRKAMTKDAGELQALVNSMNQSEFQAFQIGADEALRAFAGTTSGQTRLLNMWREPAMQEKLKLFFPSERAYRQFASKIAAEARLKGTESVGRGSQTAGREARMEDVGVQTMQDVGGLAAAAKSMDIGSLINMLGNIKQRTIVPEPVRNEIGRILMSKATSGDEIRMLREVIKKMEEEQARQGTRTGLIGGQLGVQAIEPVTESLRSLLQ